VEFCRRLTEKEGKTYRLPTEAQWEYSCRAGTTTPFSFGKTCNGSEANCDGRQPYGTATSGPALPRPTTVGSYKPNAFGLYDMHGNVYQWCSDWFASGYYARSPVDDPPGILPIDLNPNAPQVRAGTVPRVARGGAFYESPARCRSAGRYSFEPYKSAAGFRVMHQPD
jgi:formylglycine-generating enzyme required for sulfatase activity